MTNSKEIIFEFIPQGRFVKVSAIDVDSGLEVSIIGAAAAERSTLQQLAVQKLQYILAKQKT